MKTRTLHDAIAIALFAAGLGAAGLAAARDGAQDGAQEASPQATRADAVTLDRVAVTGSRIKRAAIEGALPVLVLDRQQIEASGDISVADFLRNTSLNSFGSYQSASGSSWLGASTVSLRGMGQGRTLVLIDGRRAPTSPQIGDANDLNIIPLAAVERFEVLSDGASAIYGSDAIAGVINVITRKDFEGAEISVGKGFPRRDGGDTQEASILFGTSGERGRLLGGASYNGRDILYTVDRDFWMSTPGASTYSNNLMTSEPNPNNATYGYSPLGWVNHPLYGSTVPEGCAERNFWIQGAGSRQRCQFDHKQQSANLAKSETTAAFLRGDHQINDTWQTYFKATVSRAEGRGRFASVPSSPWPGGDIFIPVGSPNHPGNPQGFNAGRTEGYAPDVPYFLRHRFSAAGPRDDATETTTYDFLLGFEGRLGIFDLDYGVRRTESRFVRFGSNYIVGGLAQQAISEGRYNIYTPGSNPAGIVDAFTATISRDAKTVNDEVFASAAFDLFRMRGGVAAAVVGAELREERYADVYDKLSAAGQIVGSAGASAGGGRDAGAVYFEVLMPLLDKLELNLAGRYDDYSDYGSDFSPKASLRWQPIERLALRASFGEGFRAPPLSLLTRQASFGASSVTHAPTCELQGIAAPCATQVTTYSISNGALESENSRQWGLGAVWDATDWLNLTLDHYNITIDNQITSVSIMDIYKCVTGTGTLCPQGLSTFQPGTVIPNPALGLGVIIDPVTRGIFGGQTGSANIGEVKTQGYDFAARTQFDLGDWGSLGNRLQMSYVGKYQVNGDENIGGRPGYPRLRANLGNSWKKGNLSLTWNISYISGTQSQAWRDIVGNDRADRPTSAAVRELPKRLPSWLTHDLQATWQSPWNARITFGVSNIGDKEAVIDPYYGDRFDSSIYNTWGRVPYFRYAQTF